MALYAMPYITSY